jgi:hypothetical protein
MAAAAAQAMTGAPVPGPGAPVVVSAMSSRAAMPTAVPSWAAVLMIPDAVPRSTSGTVVQAAEEQGVPGGHQAAGRRRRVQVSQHPGQRGDHHGHS